MCFCLFFTPGTSVRRRVRVWHTLACTHPTSYAYVDEYRYKCFINVNLYNWKPPKLDAYWLLTETRICVNNANSGTFKRVLRVFVWVSVWQTYPYRDDWLSANMITYWHTYIYTMHYYMINYRVSISFRNSPVKHRILFCIEYPT